MHENESLAKESTCVKTPCMGLCIVQLPMEISGAGKITPKFSLFMHGNIIFIYENIFFHV